MKKLVAIVVCFWALLLLSGFALADDGIVYHGSDYTSNKELAEKLTKLLNGQDNIFKTTPDKYKYKVGDKFPNSGLFTWGNGSSYDDGAQCYAYANAAYNYLFGESPGHGDRSYKKSKRLNKAIETGTQELTYDMLLNAGVGCGAWIRTSGTKGTYTDKNAHSIIILKYNQKSVTFLHAATDPSKNNNNYYVQITTKSWDGDGGFNDFLFKGVKKEARKRYLYSIVQPNITAGTSIWKERIIFSAVVRPVRNNTGLYNKPSVDSTCVFKVGKSTDLTVQAVLLNKADHYWLEVNYQGGVYYLCANNVTLQSYPDSSGTRTEMHGPNFITVPIYNYKIANYQGPSAGTDYPLTSTSIHLEGTVSGPAMITKYVGGWYFSSTGKPAVSESKWVNTNNTNCKSFKIQDKINKELKGADLFKLGKGSYIYKISVYYYGYKNVTSDSDNPLVEVAIPWTYEVPFTVGGKGNSIYTVTVTTDGNGSASASPTSGKAGTEVTLTAKPKSGYQFKEWQVVSGGVTISNNKFKIGNANVTVKAIFQKITYTVTVTNDGNGTGSANPTSGTTGTEVTLTATPNSGYQFKEWQVISGGVKISNNKFKIGNADVTVKAIFQKIIYTVTVINDGNGTGTASPASGCFGTKVKLTATPNSGYQFKRWEVISGDIYLPDNQFKIGYANVTIKAIFEKIPEYPVYVYAVGNGRAGANVRSGQPGTEVTLTAVPDKGYQFYGWRVASGGVKISNNKFKIGNDVVKIVAYFRAIREDGIEINESNFPDATFREYVKTFDENKSGVLGDHEIAAADSIQLHNSGCKSLKGIEFFTSLYMLDCSACGLTELDISQNTELGVLLCEDNQLSELNLSHNTKLKELNCLNNKLTMIDVSNCPSLVKVVNETARKDQGLWNNDDIGFLWTDPDVRVVPVAVTEVLLNHTGLRLLIGNTSTLTATIFPTYAGNHEVTWYSENPGVATVDENGKVTAVASGITTISATAKSGGATASCSVQVASADEIAIDETNFPSEGFRNYVNRYDKNENGSLSREELGSATKINAVSREFVNIKGIEFFTDLEYLICIECELESVDLSKNTKLKELDLSMNELASLDVSNNTNLTDLACGQNHLTTLDLGNNPNLNSLDCSENQLTHLDITLNTKLARVVIRFNNITNLDIRQCPSLVRLVSEGDYEERNDGTYAWTMEPTEEWHEVGEYLYKYDLIADMKTKLTVPEIEKQYTVTVANDGNGTGVADPGIGKAGTLVTLTATPNEGYRFKAWEVVYGDVVIENNQFSIGNSNVMINAVFEELEPETINVIKNGGLYELNPNEMTATLIAPKTSEIKSLTIPASVEYNGDEYDVFEIAAGACKGMAKLKKLTIGANVEIIGANAFASCEKLTTVTIGKSVIEIRKGAFKDCIALTAVTIPAKVKKIGEKAFYGCEKLKTVTFKTTKLTEKTVGENAFGKNHKKAVYKCPAKKLKAYKKILTDKGGIYKTAKVQ